MDKRLQIKSIFDNVASIKIMAGYGDFNMNLYTHAGLT